jgi:protein arginine N-methyltransferase 7
MLAAKAGAKHVYTIEANPDYARLATEIVELNHLDKKVTVLNTLSTNVQVKEGAQDSPLFVSYHCK